jgi:hypothetical protein
MTRTARSTSSRFVEHVLFVCGLVEATKISQRFHGAHVAEQSEFREERSEKQKQASNCFAESLHAIEKQGKVKPRASWLRREPPGIALANHITPISCELRSDK